MSCDMKWLAADDRGRVLLFTVWNTAVETKPFSFTSLTRTPGTKRIASVVVVFFERDPRAPLVHI